MFLGSIEYDKLHTEFIIKDEHEGIEIKKDDKSEDQESISLGPTQTEQPGCT